MQAMFELVPHSVSETVGWVILQSTWQTTLVALVVAALLFTLKSASSHLRYVVACLGLIAATTLPIATATMRASDAASGSTAAAITPVDDGVRIGFIEVTSPVASEFDQASLTRALTPLLPWLFWMWLVGIVLRSLRLGVGFVAVSRLRQQARPVDDAWHEAFARLCLRLKIHRPVVLGQSDRAEVPFVVGWLRPMIVVPTAAFAGIPPVHLEGIIAHELAHVRRHDYFVNLIQVGIETVFFFHPAVWWLSERIRIEREHCCDDLAADACYGPVCIARALAMLEELRAAPAYAMSSGGGSLLDRIVRLTGPKPRPTDRGVAVITVVLSLLAVSLLASVMVTSTEKATEPPKTKAPAVAHSDLAEPPKAKTPAVAHSDLTDRQRDRLRRSGLDQDDIAKFASLGVTRYSVLRRFASLGIDPSDFIAYRRAGYTRPKDLINLARHGVSPSDIDEFTQVGLSKLPTRLLLRLARHGVDANDAKALLNLVGEPRRNSEERISLIVHLARLGIDANDIDEYRASGYDLAVDDIRRLARLGIDGNDLANLVRAGFQVSVDEVIDMRRHGIDADDIQELKAAGFTVISIDEAVDLARHGVDADDIRELKAVGLANISTKQAVDLARHGIDANDISKFRSSGFPTISVAEAIDLARYGIDANDVRAYRSAGLTSASVEDLVELARRGIAPDRIDRVIAMNERGRRRPRERSRSRQRRPHPSPTPRAHQP